MLPGMALNSRLSLPKSWDYKHTPPRLAFGGMLRPAHAASQASFWTQSNFPGEALWNLRLDLLRHCVKHL